MTKNTGKGGKTRKRGKNGPGDPLIKELVLKRDGQEYARVVKILGDRRLLAKCYNETGATQERLCIIPGAFRKKVWINMDDIILIGVRSYQDDKVDVIYKYSIQDAKKLMKKGEIPNMDTDKNKKAGVKEEDDLGIQFGVPDKDEDDDSFEEDKEEKRRREKEQQRIKRVQMANANSEYVDTDLLPPSDSEENSDDETKVTTGRLNEKQQIVETDDDDEITVDDL